MSQDKVAIVVDAEAAQFMRTLVNTAMEASGEALNFVPSVEVKAMIVEKRSHLLDLKDAIDLALLGVEGL